MVYVLGFMLIGIDASRANLSEKTGVEWYAWHLIENLKKQSVKNAVDETGKNIQFVLYSYKSLEGDLAKLPKNWTEKVLHWPPKRFWTQIRLSFEMLVNPPDVLFVPSHVFPIIHPAKTVLTIHDVAASKFPKSYSKFQGWYTIWAAKYAIHNLWRIITPSIFTKKELSEISKMGYKEIEGKVKVIHHGYDRQYRKIYDKIAINQVLEKYKIKQSFFLNVGRLEERKNTKRIIQAFNHLSRNIKLEIAPNREGFEVAQIQSSLGYNLVLVGNPGYGYEEVAKTIDGSPYKDRIIRLGWVKTEDIVCLMNAAEVFVFTSLHEGFGLPVLEAMACGTPIVATRGSCAEELVGDACVYADSSDVWSITQGITEILENNELRNTLVKKGLEKVADFSWEKSAAETYELLME